MRRFVTDAGHELRTPLTSVRGFAELYRIGAVDQGPALDDAMTRIGAEAARMGILVDDLLLLARLDQQRPLQVIDVEVVEEPGDHGVDPGVTVGTIARYSTLVPLHLAAAIRAVLSTIMGLGESSCSGVAAVPGYGAAADRGSLEDALDEHLSPGWAYAYDLPTSMNAT